MVTKHMAQRGRICVCGSISTYNDSEKPKFPLFNWNILSRELTIRGLVVYAYQEEFGTAFNELVPLVKKGDLKFKETVYDFEKMPEAFVGLFKDDNTGKAIVKASNYP